MCKFFVLLGKWQAVTDMPDINTPNIIHLNYNTMYTQKLTANNYSTNTAIYQGSRHEQHYTNMMQEADRAEKC